MLLNVMGCRKIMTVLKMKYGREDICETVAKNALKYLKLISFVDNKSLNSNQIFLSTRLKRLLYKSSLYLLFNLE